MNNSAADKQDWLFGVFNGGNGRFKRFSRDVLRLRKGGFFHRICPAAAAARQRCADWISNSYSLCLAVIWHLAVHPPRACMERPADIFKPALRRLSPDAGEKNLVKERGLSIKELLGNSFMTAR